MSPEMEKSISEYMKVIHEDNERVYYLLENAEYLDDDGYPTDEAIEIIEKWSHFKNKHGIEGLFRFMNTIWHLKSWGWNEGEEDDEYGRDKKVYRYHISTAGWSGNEAIIHALEHNKHYVWAQVWVSSKRGGHYVFERKIGEDE